MGLESVGDLAIHVILKKLPPEDVGRVACVNKRFRSSASEDPLWIKFCSDDLSLTQPIGPLRTRLSSFKEAYQSWREAFGMYPWPLVKRVKRCWDRLTTWLTDNFPEAGATLRKGASEAEIQELESALEVKLPIPTRILYRFHSGQDIPKGHLTTGEFGSSLGIIGGYVLYTHYVNVCLLPISQVIEDTQRFTRQLGFFRRSNSKFILVAASIAYSEKLFFLNCTNGQLYTGTVNFRAGGEMVPCVPHDLISIGHGLNSEQQQDAMLLWLEEHGRRLQHGFIKLHEEHNVRAINLFPEEPPLCSTAVTKGVQVRASALFIPEMSDLQHDVERYLFAYSIRMSLERQGCIINGMYFSSCQLHWRHWIIRADDKVVSDFNGEAVIGQFPLLRPGDKEFVYQSCTPIPTSSGSVEGSFTFVPGRLEEPKGAAFLVTVAHFPLQLPDYVF